jgi:hypothetical protein
VNILNRLKRSNGARLGLCLAVSLLWSRAATAEVTLVEKDGWKFSFEGRVDAFLSVGKGDDFPNPTPDPSAGSGFYISPNRIVMGKTSLGWGVGRPDVGWLSAYQEDNNQKFVGARIRSGYYPNIMAFAITRQVTETTSIRGYISMWTTVESLGRDKWAPLTPEAREGYFTAAGPWGSVSVGRMLGWLGRMSYEIDGAYGHGYGLGIPCTDALGPGCGHIGTGVLFPGYSAGMSYSSPSLAGLQFHVGIFDPVAIVPFGGTPSNLTRTPIVRPEGALTYGIPFGSLGKLRLAVEGLYQPISRTDTDPVTMMPTNTVTTTIWGVSGGARVEAGPLRVGLAAFRAKGIGLSSLGSSVAAADNDPSHARCIDTDNDPTTPCVSVNSYELRPSTGFYGQLALVFGPWQVGGGYGLAILDQVAYDKLNPNLSVIHYQRGASGVVYYQMSDSVVLGLDAFLYNAGWYGAPLLNVDANGNPTTATGQHLVGEKQQLVFVNLGVTYHW